MNATEIIAAKRDGKTLSNSQLQFLIEKYSSNVIPDYQMAAFAMAVYFQGMNADEIVYLTEAMLHSGKVMSWPNNGRPKVDKHSTGGIGDKISIPLAPILACAGMDVPMISGRGLGATGGTLDKLESIPGFRTDLSTLETQNQVAEIGCVITGANQEIAPADRKLYALRDVTATVPSIPLITASILSKKLSEGLNALVLDVKCGSGAFMKTFEESNELATTLVKVANQAGVKTSALITNMNQPLGKLIGNSVEIEESLEILDGKGPDDIRQLVTELAAELMRSAGFPDVDSNHKTIEKIIASGLAMEKFQRMVSEQGGKLEHLVQRDKLNVIVSSHEGYLTSFDSEKIGWAIIAMGGGRKQIGDTINPSVGIEVLVNQGDLIEIGQPLFHVFCNNGVDPELESLLTQSLVLTNDPEEPPPLIMSRVS